jgi:hypothetical protein
MYWLQLQQSVRCRTDRQLLKKYDLMKTNQDHNMRCTDTSNAPEFLVTPQSFHRETAVQLEKAVKHHRQAALLHDCGDARQAETHASIACKHTAHALEVSRRALNLLHR